MVTCRLAHCGCSSLCLNAVAYVLMWSPVSQSACDGLDKVNLCYCGDVGKVARDVLYQDTLQAIYYMLPAMTRMTPKK